MKIAATAVAVASALLVSTAIGPVASAATNKNVKSTAPTAKVVAAAVQVAPVARMIVVNPGDYLTMLAEGNNSSVQRLYDANTGIENPDLIFPGQELKVPDEKEAIAHRDMPVASAVAQQVQVEAQGATSARTSVSSDAPTVASGSVWDQLAACEAGGNWSINTGNGYYGGLQFTLSSWQGVGGAGYPNQASREEQILRGQMLQARSGWGAWPACSSRLGL
ncbi:transglycosylase family protein [Aeromicrobium sp.]|nr:transglycosylase family protein [Candidatus Saccharibacteria bacterium]